MELGGKSPAIIFSDADLEPAAFQTQFSIRFNSGQVCVANSRIYVQESVADKFIALFRKQFAVLNAGDPLNPETSHGPQIDKAQYNRIQEYLGIGEKDGSLTLGGDAKDGFFVKPTIFERVPEDSRLMREEVFGPVVTINTFKTEEEAIEKANATEFGLYASVFTKDLERALRMSRALEAGVVAVNCTSPTSTKDSAFGGYKMSGTGREGFLYSIDNFVQTKTILIKSGDVGGLFG
jgi:NAD-dependent aldehyde dehydrogenases